MALILSCSESEKSGRKPMEDKSWRRSDAAKADRHSIRAIMRPTPSDRRIFSINAGIFSSSLALMRMPRRAFSSRLRMGLVSGRSRNASPQKFSVKWMTVEWTGLVEGGSEVAPGPAGEGAAVPEDAEGSPDTASSNRQ